MRILQIHNSYLLGGGEDAVVAAERRLLTEYGHDVTIFSVSNEDEISSPLSKIKTAWFAPYSKRMKLKLKALLADVKPDVVHVHNFFPLITASVYDACREAGVPVVQTLHNYRLICPGALLMRDGKICEECLGHSPYHSVLHRCYRGSRLGTLAVARMVATHKKLRTWHTKVDRFIALTEFARAKFIADGFPADKIAVKPNFAPIQGAGSRSGERSGALFVGRLSEEKGVQTLLESWTDMTSVLRIIGEGPLHDEARIQNRANVDLLGARTSSEVMAAMSASEFLVTPSLCYEGFPMVIVEAFSCGLPVIASCLGAMAEIIEDGVTGLLFSPGDAQDLAAKVRWAFEHPEEMLRMGQNARKVYHLHYTPEENCRQLIAIYELAIGERLQ